MQVLERLLAATPLPPPVDDVDQLLAAFDAMLQAREAILADLQGESGSARDSDLVRELFAREQAWREALTTAMAAVRAQQQGARQLRMYATTVANSL